MTGARRISGFVRRLCGARDGAVAIEFAIVAIPFLFMMFSILEIGRLYALSSVLEDATMDAGRRIRTGEMQTSGASAATFKAAVCDRMSIFEGECNQRLSVDVRVMPQFANQTPPDPVTGDSFSEGQLTYQPGGANDIVLVRTFWRAPLFAPLVTQGLQKLSDGSAVLTAAATFRTEPYQ